MAPSLHQVLAHLQRWTLAPTADLSDSVLLGRYVQHRDEAAFAALVARYGALVLRVCRRILGTDREVEDAFQAAFLILARRAASLRQPEALPGWQRLASRR
jgi:DNA-directed RNA polymerase specialized sigma24 family protein